MPTPFYHLRIAEVLFGHPELDATAREQIAQYFPAFLLGHVAPDVQTISGQKRAQTHFFELPIYKNSAPAWEQMLVDQPSLRAEQIHDMERAVFVAGYLCHLQADWFWVEQIFAPYFGPRATWKDFRQRLYLHNVLRAYLDFQVLENLNGSVRSGLAQVHPQDWLPFVDREHLEAWQVFLSDQLKPGAAIQTVEVFAARQGISAQAYYQLINTESEMQHQIFDFLPRQKLSDFWDHLIHQHLTLVKIYLAQAG